ncbi:MAG: Uma2 family endonuclease [Candidatus Bipolaricaulota bacterium]|nr:Uma2 family endonuclease [Candidatus Bipolaricaulota bacterium]
MAVQVRMTAQQLAELTDDRYKKSELAKGELIVMSPTGFEHGIVSARIAQLLSDFVRARELGYICGAETGFLLHRDPDTVRAPDVSFVRKEKVSAGALPTSFAEFAPDLAVEVISPTDRSDEIEHKISDYLAAGTCLIWVVYPRTQTVYVYQRGRAVQRLSAEDTLSGEDVLPGFSVIVAELFP